MKKKINIKNILLIIILFLFIISYYFIYKKINKKIIYIGCLYSKTGIIGKDSYNNYICLKESLNYAIKKYNINIEFIFLYKDLSDNINNYYNWVEECIKKYNVKYFFGCWRSSERMKIIPLLNKYNARLFYPLQYEGFECVKNINYFGTTPNQQLIPGLKYMFSKFSNYKNIYVIGNNYIYPLRSNNIIKKFIKNNPIYQKKYAGSCFFNDNNKNILFKKFIKKIFDESPNGAIILNLINGYNINLEFKKELYIAYYKKFKIIPIKYYYETDKLLKYINDNFKDKNKNEIEIYQKYPLISFSISENSYDIKDQKYNFNNYYVNNFCNQILENNIYQIYNGLRSVDKDTNFLQSYSSQYNIKVGAEQYSTFLSSLFFCKTISLLLKKNLDIYNPIIYDKYKYISIISINGEHILNNNNNITNNFIVSKIGYNNIFNIVYQSYKTIVPKLYIETDKNIQCNFLNNKQAITIF
tara:strand:+ start:217 stop:1626 length:1410 start_codon:yes stop_codon:yes gene_type:complete